VAAVVWGAVAAATGESLQAFANFVYPLSLMTDEIQIEVRFGRMPKPARWQRALPRIREPRWDV